MQLPSPRYICIHGHFYQPPRENPWLEAIEVQDSAHPWHDWNQRIAEECYTPNTDARILDEQGWLVDIVNNYEHISFDFGPTLLPWLERHVPDTYEAIIEADATSRKTRSGHGNALAQAFHHTILPLASTRDKATQIVWGIKDFEHRFGRDPEGMWLPETAVDSEVLEILVQNGIRFTILAPRQARRFRESARGQWVTVDGAAIDPTRPYICNLSQGRSIALFFYDGPISQAIAFERLLDSGEAFKNRLLAAFSDNRSWAQLVHIATDGESYGHHHRFGEMALAFAISRLSEEPAVQLTNYGEYLEKCPPTAEVEIVERSAWSCAHGVGRWSENCGCNVGHKPGWDQKWRVSLKRAMDLLRDRVDPIYARLAPNFLKDPWQARDDYVSVLLHRRKNVNRFLQRHQSRRLEESDRITALKLLELQRNRMMIYTSCGWFFDDILGIETLQILKYAARVLQLAEPFDPKLKEDFLNELSNARSNQRPFLSGDEIFSQKVWSQKVELPKVAAHATILSAFEDLREKSNLYCYRVQIQDSTREKAGERLFLISRMSLADTVTLETRSFASTLLYLGGADLRCSVKDIAGVDNYAALKGGLVHSFQRQSSTELIRTLDADFPGAYFALPDLFVEERSRIIHRVTRMMYEEQAGLFEDFYEKNKEFIALIMETGIEIPDTFLAAARFVLNRRLHHELAKLAKGVFPDGLQQILEEARSWRISLDTASAEKLIRSRIIDLLSKLRKSPWHGATPEHVLRFLDLCRDLEISVQLGEAQIGFFRIAKLLQNNCQGLPTAFPELARRLKVRINDSAQI
jgi:alpha-amylase/alpha-mannosidase (GH57 family)